MNEFNNEAPSLTLNPNLEADMPVKKNEVRPVESVMDESMLTEEEKQQVEAFSKQIDINNSTMILQYGAGTQQKMAGFSEKALENVKSKDLGEIGDMLTGLVKELKGFDAEEQKGFLGFFKKSADKLDSMKMKYSKAEENVGKIVESLEKHQIRLLKDISILDQMYDMNKTYFKELSMYIIAGRKKLLEIENGELARLREKALTSGKQEDAQEANDLQAKCDRFDKKLSDLDLTRMVSIQTAPQIRLVQNNDTMMSEKIQSTIANTIPLWKSQMVIALGIANSNEAIRAQRAVSDMTNELLRKNAENLKIATVETAKEAQRGIVDIETLKKTNEDLISTLDEVMTIQEDGRKMRREAEAELRRMEEDVKNKLLQMRKS